MFIWEVLAKYWRRKWQPTPVLLPGESQGWGSLVGFYLCDHLEKSPEIFTLQTRETYCCCLPAFHLKKGKLNIWKFSQLAALQTQKLNL